MEVLIGLIFELFKVVIQSAIYGFVIVLIYKSLFKKTLVFKAWLLTSSILAVVMLIFLNTHWGSHGLGDSRRIPLQFNKEIQIINGTQAYIQDKDNGISTMDIDSFSIAEEYVYGQLKEYNENYEGNFFLYDLGHNEIETFISPVEYHKGLVEKGLDPNAKLQDFKFYYRNYWSGWRFWLLP